MYQIAIFNFDFHLFLKKYLKICNKNTCQIFFTIYLIISHEFFLLKIGLQYSVVKSLLMSTQFILPH